MMSDHLVSSWTIFSRARRLRLSSASTVERRASVDSSSRSRSTSRATAEAASSMAVMALSSRMRSRSSMPRILLERAPLVVPFGGHVGVYHGPEIGAHRYPHHANYSTSESFLDLTDSPSKGVVGNLLPSLCSRSGAGGVGSRSEYLSKRVASCLVKISSRARNLPFPPVPAHKHPSR